MDDAIDSVLDLCKNELMSMVTAQSEAEIWSRTIEPENGNWSAEAAQALLALKLPAADVERVNQLSVKAREGALTSPESRELDNYLNVGRALELLKAKARLSLRGRSLA
jgi:hypothetical protein